MIKAKTEEVQEKLDSHTLVKSELLVADSRGSNSCYIYNCFICGITILSSVNNDELHGFNYHNLPKSLRNRMPEVFMNCKTVLMWKALEA